MSMKKTVKSEKELHRMAMKRGASVVHSDGRRFNASGERSETLAAPAPEKEETATEAPESGPESENSGISGVAHAIHEGMEKISAQNALMLQGIIKAMGGRQDVNVKVDAPKQVEVEKEVRRAHGWELTVSRNVNGLIEKVTALPIEIEGEHGD